MAGPTNTGITGEDRDEEHEIDLNQDDPKEAVTAGLTEDQIGLNARQQTELSDPTRPENFAGAKSAQTVTDEVSATDPGYSSGHDSGVSQKEQYDTALAGASEGRHAGTYLDYLVAQKKFVEEQRKRDVALAAAMLTLPGLMNAITDLGKDYDKEEEAQNEVQAAALIVTDQLEQKIEELDNKIAEQEQFIADLKEKMASGEHDSELRNMTIELDSAELRLEALQQLRAAQAAEAESLIRESGELEQKFAEAKAEQERIEAIAKGVQDGTITLTDAEKEQLEIDTKASSDRLAELTLDRTRLQNRVDFAAGGMSPADGFVAMLTARNPDGSFANGLDPDEVKAQADLMTTFIEIRSDGIISGDDLKLMKSKLDATNMTEEQKAERFENIQKMFPGTGLGFRATEDGPTLYGEEAAAAIVAGLRSEVTQTNEQFNDISTIASTMVNQLAEQRQGLRDEIRAHEEELAKMKAGESIHILPGTSEEMAAAQIAVKEAEIRNAESRLNLIETTIDGTRTQLEETRQNYLETNQKLQDLEAQRSTVSGAELEQLNTDIAALEGQLETYKQSVIDLSDRANMARAISEISIRIEGKSHTCSAEVSAELHKGAVIDERTRITNALSQATLDGKISQAEFNQINEMFVKAQVSQETRRAFVEAVNNSGGRLGTGEFDADGNEIYLSKEESAAQLLRDMAQVEQEIKQTSSQLDGVNAEIARLEAEQARIDTEIAAAQEVVDEEVSQTAEVEADAAGAVAASMKYSSMSEYVLDNYYHGPMGNENGTSLFDAAKDPNKILTDSSGNAVFMDTETQQLYTLKMNGDEVAKDADGNQIKQAVSHEDTVDLYNKMFENKLLPRNFLPDGDGFGVGSIRIFESEVAFEPSQYDGFVGTSYAALSGGMGKDGLMNNIRASVEAQKAEEAIAVAEKAVLEGASGAQSVEVERLQGERADVAQALAALQQRRSNLQAQSTGSGNTGDNNDTSAPALKTSPEMQETLPKVYAQVDKTVGSGVISRADLDQALGADASPELRAQIEASLERDGIEIQEPDDADNTLVSTLDNSDANMTLEERMETAMAAFPFLGIGPFQVEPIPTNTFQPDPNNIYPGGMAYQSFADNEFELTHAPGDASYKEPINNGTASVPAAGETFTLAMTNQLNKETQGSVSAEEALRLEREEELRMAANNPANQGGGGGMLT